MFEGKKACKAGDNDDGPGAVVKGARCRNQMLYQADQLNEEPRRRGMTKPI